MVEKNGLYYSYQLAPRAKVFRRDVGKVTDMESMKQLMRSNGKSPILHKFPVTLKVESFSQRYIRKGS